MKLPQNQSGYCGFAEPLEPHQQTLADKASNIAETLAPKLLPLTITNELPALPIKMHSRPYPIDALGAVLGKAALSISSHVQAPVEMAAQSVLSAASLAVQGHINVARGNVGTGPVSLFLLTVAESGDRKTATDKLALKPVKEFEEKRIAVMDGKKAEFTALLAAWQMERDVTAKLYKQKEPLSKDKKAMLENDLTALEKSKPKEPEFPNITFAEPTPAALWRHYQCGLSTAGLFSDEGVGFFSGHGMREESKGLMLGEMCKLWDGSPLTRTRAESGESGVMSGRRLSTHLMIQPVIAHKVFSDNLLTLQGFLPRFLIAEIESTAGTRMLSNKDPSANIHTDADYLIFTQRLSTILNTPLPVDTESGVLQPKVLRIEGDAFVEWASVHDTMERKLNTNGEYASIKAAAAKGAEQVARIAAILAFVEEANDITPEHIARAAELVMWYLDSMVIRISNALDEQEMQDASILLGWVNQHGGELNAKDFKKLPSHLRSAKVSRARLKLLVDLGYLIVSEQNLRGQATKWRVLISNT